MKQATASELGVSAKTTKVHHAHVMRDKIRAFMLTGLVRMCMRLEQDEPWDVNTATP